MENDLLSKVTIVVTTFNTEELFSKGKIHCIKHDQP